MKDKVIADVLEVAPASASSYVSVCTEKFDTVDEEIADDDCRYLVSYEDEDGIEQIETFDEEPRDLEVDAISYRRISSVDEVL